MNWIEATRSHNGEAFVGLVKFKITFGPKTDKGKGSPGERIEEGTLKGAVITNEIEVEEDCALELYKRLGFLLGKRK